MCMSPSPGLCTLAHLVNSSMSTQERSFRLRKVKFLSSSRRSLRNSTGREGFPPPIQSMEGNECFDGHTDDQEAIEPPTPQYTGGKITCPCRPSKRLKAGYASNAKKDKGNGSLGSNVGITEALTTLVRSLHSLNRSSCSAVKS